MRSALPPFPPLIVPMGYSVVKRLLMVKGAKCADGASLVMRYLHTFPPLVAYREAFRRLPILERIDARTRNS